MRLEQVILRNLIANEDYMRKVLPFLRDEYFLDRTDKNIFTEIRKFSDTYNSTPSPEAIEIAIQERRNLKSEEVESCLTAIQEFRVKNDEPPKLDWLVNKTESFCQEKAVYNAVLNSISILDGKDSTQEKGAIPKILSDALAISFDSSVGHDYLDDSDSRYEFYHRKEERIPFDLDYFNKITKGGLPKKTLNIALAGTGVGKSLFMCHVAAGCMTLGKNVLYITMEMAEEKIAERIDANLLDVTMDELSTMPKETFFKKLERVKTKTTGRLIIKEYPTSGAGSANFRHLINELKLKKNFMPDIIYIDYLNICSSSRVKYSANMNSYTYIKSIAEELRGLAVEFNLPVVSATQTTRSGYNNSDVELSDTSESFALPATADLMFALTTSEELESLGQIMVKQLKNRYNDLAKNKRFVVGVDRSKMKLYDVDQSAQDGIQDDKPLMDKTEFGDRDSDFFKKRSKFGKNMNGFA